MKNIVLVQLDAMAGACNNCKSLAKPGEVVVHLVAANNRYAADGGIPPVRNLYCRACWDELVSKANTGTESKWPSFAKLGESAPRGKLTRQWFVLKGGVEDPMERFRDSATHCKEGVR